MEAIFNSVFPIIIERDKKPEQIASGVLLEIKNHLFLLTSAHVFDDIQKFPLLIPTNSGFTKTNFSAACLPNTDENRVGDKIDLAYIKLNFDLKKNFSQGISPLTLNNVDTTDYKEKDDIYTFSGFPYRKTKYKENTIQSELYSFTGGLAPKETYDNLNYSPNTNILIDFNRKKTINILGDISTAPMPHGISGGGIFSYSKDISRLVTGNNIYRLVGIGHSYHEAQKILAGTSINLYLEIIYRNNPTLINNLDEIQGWTPLFNCVTYYKKDEWEIIKNTLEDADKLHSTWEEWRIATENYIEHLNSEKIQCRRMIFNINSFKEYCEKNKLPLIGRSRISYSSDLFAKEILEKKITFIVEN